MADSRISFRVPSPLRDQLSAAATAEGRSLSSLVVTILDRGIVERARERELLRRALDEQRREAA